MCIRLKRLRFSPLSQTNRFGNKEENFKFRERKWYLNNMMIFVVLDTDSAKSTVHAIQEVHIASILRAITMQLACFKEAIFEQSFQPSVVLFITQIKIKSQLISTNHMNDLIFHNNKNTNNNNNMNSNNNNMNDNNNNNNDIKIEFYMVTRKIWPITTSTSQLVLHFLFNQFLN